jgi:ribosomal protein S18 acetylase RimI-like enzyme
VNVRRATEADAPALQELWDEYSAEVPEPPGFPEESWEEEWLAARRDIDGGSVFVADEDGRLVGVAQMTAPERGVAHLVWAHVRPEWRRRGIAKALVRECIREARERGATLITLEALASNETALAVWRRLGFEEVEYFMGVPLETIEGRLADVRVGESRASTHVQTDDRVSVDRALAQFVPRLDAPDIAEAANGWIRIRAPLLDADRDAQSRFARELSDRLGAVVVALALEHGAVVRFRLYERGRMVDEYLSVPTFYGELPKGDELALEANPTLVARLTNADRDEVRHVVRTAPTPAELPPAAELYEQVARTMGLEP